jgi:hypothetical protein
MWPWGHLAFAYLAYRGWDLLRGRRSIADEVVLALGVGALLPDLIDKPLAWSVTLLPSGRSLAHSMLTIGLVGLVLAALLQRSNQPRLAGAAYFGWASHTVADAVPGLVTGEIEAVFFWNWPLAPHPVYRMDEAFLPHFARLGDNLGALAAGEFGRAGWLGYEVLLVLVAAIVWFVDGWPGLRPALEWVRGGLGTEGP